MQQMNHLAFYVILILRRLGNKIVMPVHGAAIVARTHIASFGADNCVCLFVRYSKWFTSKLLSQVSCGYSVGVIAYVTNGMCVIKPIHYIRPFLRLRIFTSRQYAVRNSPSGSDMK